MAAVNKGLVLKMGVNSAAWSTPPAAPTPEPLDLSQLHLA